MSFDLNKIPEDAKCFRMSSPASISAKGADDVRRFSAVGYSGEPITNHPYWGTVAFDLTGMQVPNPMPMLMGHDPDKIAGFSQQFDLNGKLNLEGVLSKTTQFGKDVAALADEGFPWQMSVRIKPLVLEEIAPGAFSEVNGKILNGPAVVFRKSKISETSFTPIGWDDKTSATVLSFTTPSQEATMAMTPEELAAFNKANDDLKLSVEKLTEATNKITSLEGELKAFKDKELQAAKDAREAKITELATLLGQTFDDETVAKYTALDETTFSLVFNNAKVMAEKITKTDEGTQLPENLFSEQAKGDPEKGGKSTKSLLEVDAERRREEFSKRKG